MIQMRFQTDAELESNIRLKQEELREMTTELRKRRANGGGIRMYQCEHCGKKSLDEEEIYEHLLNDHNYPEEDAGLSTLEIIG
jgi:hypothetical protein